MIRVSKVVLNTAVIVAGMIFVPGISKAESPVQASEQAVTPVPQPTDEQLLKYVQASQKVAMVSDKYQPKLQAAADEGAREQVIREADEEMVQQVQKTGMTVDEYNRISMATQYDPKLRQKVIDLVNQ